VAGGAFLTHGRSMGLCGAGEFKHSDGFGLLTCKAVCLTKLNPHEHWLWPVVGCSLSSAQVPAHLLCGVAPTSALLLNRCWYRPRQRAPAAQAGQGSGNIKLRGLDPAACTQVRAGLLLITCVEMLTSPAARNSS
jgi:hypothetical protein